MPKAYIDAWKVANPDKVRAARQRENEKRAMRRDELNAKEREFYHKNREDILARRRIRAAENPNYFASAITWREQHREEARAKSQAWREADRDRARASNKAWRQANPEKCREISRLKKVRKRKKIIEFLNKAQKGRCAYCREKLVLGEFHLDHIMPRALGGTNSKSNFQLACKTCNLSKNARHPIEFAQSLGKLI